MIKKFMNTKGIRAYQNYINGEWVNSSSS